MAFKLPSPDVPIVADPQTGVIDADWFDQLRKLEPTAPATVANLPAIHTEGARNFVTDATATTFASIVAGGGANNVPVYDDGTNWRIG
jgi:hypothetical protein